MDRVPVIFQPAGVQAQVTRGATIHEAAVEAGVALEAPCGGNARCGRCRVVVVGDVTPLTDDEQSILSEQVVTAGTRLSCRTRILGPTTITLPPSPGQLRVLGSATRGVTTQGWAAVVGAVPGRLGIAIDLGTTTLAVELVDLDSGSTLATAASVNPQRRLGHDVMTRLSHAVAGIADVLRDVVTTELSQLCAQTLAYAGGRPGALEMVVICGNTVMTHLLLGADTIGLATAPYRPALAGPILTTTEEVGLTRLGHAAVHILPSPSAFVGGDIVAGLLATDLTSHEDAALLLDLGTNGELALWTGTRLVATSTAAGPAFEAAGIAWGMAATDGAIERVELDGDTLRLHTIGGAAAQGLCGSGLLDLVAVLLEAGIIDATGRMLDDVPSSLANRVVDDSEGVRTFIVDATTGVRLTQMDIRQLQLAKGAVQTGIGILLEHAGVEAADVANIIVAGGFGHHLQTAALTALGIVPFAWRPRITFGGNTALAGARLALVDPIVRDRATELSMRIETIDLAAMPAFNERFLAAMSFPGPRA